jgi:hypothetical protein
MSYEYVYSREFIAEDSSWNIENILRVDEQGNQILLENEVKVALPGLSFDFYAGYDHDPSIVKFMFIEELTPEQASTLDITVYKHKNNL